MKTMEKEIINRVANSTLVTINLEDFYPKGECVEYDIAKNLYQGLILREKEFRTFCKEHDWSEYTEKNVAIVCSADAIVPGWAYMLLATYLQPHANRVIFGNLSHLYNALFQDALTKIDLSEYEGAKVIIKGCGNLPVPDFAYVELTRLLLPHVSSLMYGEACSAVPLYKKPKSKK